MRSNPIRDLINVYTLNGMDLHSMDEADILEKLQTPQRLVDDFLARLEDVARDQRLTADGKKYEAAEAGRRLLAGTEAWAKPLRAGVETHEASLRKELSAAVGPKPPSDPARALEAALVRQEIRRAAADLSDQQIEILFLQGDAQVRQALVEAPRITVRNGAVQVRPFVSDEVRDEALWETAAELKPDEAARLEDVRRVGAIYETVVGQVTEHVRKAAPEAIERSDPVVA